MLNARRIVVMLLILQTLIGCGDEFSRWPTTNFDQKKWQETNETERYAYVRSLIESKKLIDLTKRQVFEILRTPSFEDASEEYVTYVVKADSGSVYLLDIRFEDKQAKKVVSKVFLRAD